MPNVAEGNCVYMKVEQPSFGQWFSGNCDETTMYYMCEAELLGLAI